MWVVVPELGGSLLRSPPNFTSFHILPTRPEIVDSEDRDQVSGHVKGSNGGRRQPSTWWSGRVYRRITTSTESRRETSK